MSSVVTPPYDVISPEGQERYYQIHPNNIIRLDFDKGYIYPHEQTLPGPKADRLKLTQSCQANLSSIFALFPDGNNEVDSYLSAMAVSKPEIDFTDDTGVKNKLWVIKEKQTIDRLVTLMKEKPLFI